ncbi:PDR/VanB family oxidoreductase [Paenarthrobacter ureafaciens]|jgi:ferredoxin-NADP reductase|uniref:PDR/VanB family oxidoreductase n=1 Tax=Paenarthrobacter ureafaciens TaxID=37931 RepID=UPI001C2CBA47|nr:PDR/VanB family oxidoreductase [Paenarthrobacter ureafaciens]
MSSSPYSPISGGSRLNLVVRAVRDLSPRVREIEFTQINDSPLPSFTPGSNLGIAWSEERWNFYSLTGPGFEPSSYTISVQREDEGTGGSAWMHRLQPRDAVTCTTPRSEFPPVHSARRHLLIAGGIGVTPILAHARALAAAAKDYEVHYVSREVPAPHLEDLNGLGTSVVHSRCRDEFWRKLGPALYQQPIGTHLYVCGPAAMTEEVQTSARRAGWPTGRLHAEAFTGGIVTNGEPFIASLISSGKTIDVSANLSLLEALEQAGVKVPNMCRRGVCGECRLEVAAGIPDHHDFVLSEEEKAGSQFIMPCVSRARSEHLELKL